MCENTIYMGHMGHRFSQTPEQTQLRCVFGSQITWDTGKTGEQMPKLKSGINTVQDSKAGKFSTASQPSGAEVANVQKQPVANGISVASDPHFQQHRASCLNAWGVLVEKLNGLTDQSGFNSTASVWMWGKFWGWFEVMEAEAMELIEAGDRTGLKVLLEESWKKIVGVIEDWDRACGAFGLPLNSIKGETR